MSQQNDPSNPADSRPPDEGTMIMQPAADTSDNPAPPVASAPGATVGLCPNPACRQPVGPDVRFCQACGTALEEQRQRPWLLVAGLVWLLIAAGAYFLLYSSAFVIGGP